MQLPRPWRAVRYLAAAYTLGMSIVLLAFWLWDAAQEGGFYIGGDARHPWGFAEAFMFGLWLTSCAITGWNAMDDLAKSSSRGVG